MGINGKGAKKSGHGKQLSLCDNFMSDPGPAVKIAMNESIKSSPLSREQIVEEMNSLAVMAGIKCNGRSQKVTPALLDKWVAGGSGGHHIPLRLLPIFCRVVGSNLPLEVYGKTFPGARIISNDDYQVLEWARAEIRCRQARKMARRKSQEIGID